MEKRIAKDSLQIIIVSLAAIIYGAITTAFGPSYKSNIDQVGMAALVLGLIFWLYVNILMLFNQQLSQRKEVTFHVLLIGLYIAYKVYNKPSLSI